MIPSFSDKQIMRIIMLEYYLYNKIELIDIYKLMFQAYFGPTHITGNAAMIKEGIDQECTGMIGNPRVVIQDIGCAKGFVRIGLGKDTHIDIESLSIAIIESKLSEGIDWELWTWIWLHVSCMISSAFPPEKVQYIITAYLEKQKIPSHSQGYKEANNPHYRLLKYDLCPWLFEKKRQENI